MSTPVAGPLAVTPLYAVPASDGLAFWDDPGQTWQSVAPWLAAPPAGGPYLPLTGGTITGNLTVNGTTSLAVATATTPAAADNSTRIATTAWVTAKGYVTGGPYLPLTAGTTVPLTGILKVDFNSGVASPAPPAGTMLWLDQADGAVSRLVFDGHGVGNPPNLSFRVARGTRAAPTAIQANDTIGQVSLFGYGATGYTSSNRGGIFGIATQNWTDTAQGTQWQIQTVPIGTTAPVSSLVINDVGLTIAGTSLNFVSSASGGGPKVHADLTNMLFQTGSGNGGYYWYNSGGTQLMFLSSVGNLNAISNVVAQNTAATFGSVALVTGNATLPGFIEWRNPSATLSGGTRRGYMGWDPNNVVLTLENGSNFYVVGGEIISTLGAGAYGGLRLVGGNYGAFFRNDGAALYLLLTASGNPYGIYNGLRPFMVNVATGSVTIGNGLALTGGTDPGPSTGAAGFYPTRIRFQQSSGDEASAGMIDYGNINATALSIIGKGTAINSRVVQIYDTLNVQTIQASGGITGALIKATGSNAGLFFADRTGASGDWAWYCPGSGAAVLNNSSIGGDLIAINTARIIYPTVNNTGKVGTSGLAFNEAWCFAYQNPSDRRDKTDFADLPDCLPLVAALRPQQFRWRHGPDRKRAHWGFVAQDVEREMAGTEFGGHTVDPKHGGQGIAYSELTACLWKAVQELAAQVEELRHGRIA